jgi:ATP-dependent RNA helicase DHX29
VWGLQFQGIAHSSLKSPLDSKLAQLVSDAAFVDRKIKFRIPAKTGLALKHLRNQLVAVLDERLRNKPITESQERWMDIVFVVLGKLRPEQDSTTQNVVLDVVRN